MYEFLKKVPLFAELSQEDLERLCERVEEVHLTAGEELFAEGSPADRAYVIEDGAVEIIKHSGGREILLTVLHSGQVIGEMALIEDTTRNATVRALEDSTLLAIHQEQMDYLLRNSGSAAWTVLQTMIARLRSTTTMLRQSDKMIQLGTLTAGVAHELNNPAAAVKRGADQLKSTLVNFEEATTRLARLELSTVQHAHLQALASRSQEEALRVNQMDLLARNDLQSELEEWLEDHGVDDPWDLSAAILDMGLDALSIETELESFSADQLSPVIEWLSTKSELSSLLMEIEQGAGRISEIVKSLKIYSYLDQAPVQEVDLLEGLESTLVILRNKLKEGIRVHRDYAAELPKIQAYGSELNQVWTNLIDNAADALGGTGDITIHVHPDGPDWVMVEIEDNGPGIPQEIQSRVFDAFFTTKPPGKGTGLGLEISYNIVVNRHHGEIKLFSKPGRTCFRVSLPVDFSKTKAKAVAMGQQFQAEDFEIRQILETAKTIAVVGISARQDRAANSVPVYLQEHGYKIIPVNPTEVEILGEKSFPDLRSIAEIVDVVQVFRASDEAPEIVEAAIAIGAKAIWMQEGIVNQEAAETALKAGLKVVMNVCMRVKHKQLIGG